MDDYVEEVAPADTGLTGDDVYFAVRDAVQDAFSDGAVEVILSPEQVDNLANCVGESVSDAIADSSPVSSVTDGEILVPGEGELVVLERLVEDILSYFQEDDNKILSDIRTHTNAIKTSVASIQQSVAPHPVLTTDFADYTVTEGLLLLIFLFMFMKTCVRIIKGGFSWLG